MFQTNAYSSVLEKYRDRALNDKLSGLMDAHLCRTVMKQVLSKPPVCVRRRNIFSLSVKSATCAIAAKLLEI